MRREPENTDTVSVLHVAHVDDGGDGGVDFQFSLLAILGEGDGIAALLEKPPVHAMKVARDDLPLLPVSMGGIKVVYEHC